MYCLYARKNNDKLEKIDEIEIRKIHSYKFECHFVTHLNASVLRENQNEHVYIFRI